MDRGILDLAPDFRALFEHTTDAVFLLRLDGVCLDANPRATAMFGYTREEFTRLDVIALVDQAEQTDSHARLGDFEQGQTFPPYERACLRKDGALLHVEVSAHCLFDAGGAPLYVQVIMRDITELAQRRRRQDRLLDLERLQVHLTALFAADDDPNEALNQALAQTGALLDVARAYAFGFREHERLLDNTHEWCAPGVAPQRDNLQGLVFDELIPSFLPMLTQETLIAPEHISHLPDDVRALLEPQGVTSVLILPLYTTNRLQGFLGFDEKRGPRHWQAEEIACLSTIAECYGRLLERRRYRRLLVEARNAALRSLRLKDEFVSNISHEIRTPITGVIGMLELLGESTLTGEQREFADAALVSAHNLLGVIGDILDFQQLEAGLIVLDTIPVDLHAVVAEVQGALRDQVAKNRNEFVSDLDRRLPERVMVDPTRLRQVLLNLASNAVKFTRHGRVTTRVHVLNDLHDQVRLRFEVSDTGIGVAPAQLEHIFDSFVQADGSMTRKFGGMGLGLAICKQLVELMGGVLEVQSAVGAGSTFGFTLTLPVAARARASKIHEFSRLRALVVDIDDTARYLLAQQLRLWGVAVHEEANVERGIAALSGAVDVVFWHANLATGETVRQALGLRARWPKTYWVHVEDNRFGVHAHTPAFDAYLLRPIRASDLHDLLASLTKTGAQQSKRDAWRI